MYCILHTYVHSFGEEWNGIHETKMKKDVVDLLRKLVITPS